VAAAVWFPRARAVELRTEELAATGPDEVRVRAVLSAISHGTEMLVYRGEVDADLALDLPTLSGGYGFPLKYGYASVGHVIALGRDVRGLREGDLVFALHPHQDEYVVAGSLAHRLPDRSTPLAREPAPGSRRCPMSCSAAGQCSAMCLRESYSLAASSRTPTRA